LALADLLKFPTTPKPKLVAGKSEGIPAELRTLALDMEGGSFEGLDVAMVVLSGEGGVISFPIGREVSAAEGLGLLAIAQAEMLRIRISDD
jgi:hypothetical protein